MSSPESDAARYSGMTVKEALEVADSGNNALYRAGWLDPARAREAALDVLAKEVRCYQLARALRAEMDDE